MERPMNKQRILVWDLPTRVFHWLMAGSFFGAYLTAESERYRDIHVVLGYTVLGLVAFRFLWGIVGTRYARFSSFPIAPRRVLEYLKSLFTRSPQHHVGHNPAGSLAIYAILALAALAAVTGYGAYNEIGGEWLAELHDGVAGAMLGLVFIHIGAVMISSLIHRENLVTAMLNGYKKGRAADGIRSKHWIVAAAVLIVTVGFWADSAGLLPAGMGLPETAAIQQQAHGERG
ncbi:MAG: cytochrome b/b6 domain-containing protein [Burkholderiales bacterium]|nr:cytochrome b/b6 domain-containing protein [Burkholderiales bacterium]